MIGQAKPDGYTPAPSLPQSGAWLRGLREVALARFQAMGLPQRRDEYWRYTDPTRLTVAQPATAQGAIGGGSAAFDAAGALRLVFTDGVFDGAASSADLALAGVEIDQLAEACAHDLHWARDIYGQLEANGQTPVARPLAAWNTAMAAAGVLIRVRTAVSRPIQIVYQGTDMQADVILHHCIRLEEGAQLTLLETGCSGARSNHVLEVDLGDRAQFHHLRLQGDDAVAARITHIFARLGCDSQMRSFTLSADGVLIRNEAVIEMLGADGRAHIAGAALGKGRVHHDDTVFITHGAPNCESRQVFKKVLRDGAVGVFQGKILVRPIGQKTDGYQISQALLLDDDAQFLAKPELEIYADDVKCSHGSTTGALDETALFYLRSRGVGLAQAQALLVLAFLAEVLEEIDDRDLAALVQTQLEMWLDRQQSL